MSNYASKRHTFDGTENHLICKVCGGDRGDSIHIRPYEAGLQPDAGMAAHDAAASEAAEAHVLDFLSRILDHVRTEIVKRPCRCTVAAQGLMRCRRCLLLA